MATSADGTTKGGAKGAAGGPHGDSNAGGQRRGGVQQPPPRVPSIPALISAIEDMLDTVVALDDEEGGLGPFEDPSWPSSAEVSHYLSNL